MDLSEFGREEAMDSSVLIAPQLCAAAALDLHAHPFDEHLDPSDAALYALTDFSRAPPITVASDRLIADALGDMHRLGVRALLVASRRPRDAHAIIGLITAADIARRQHGRDADTSRVDQAMTLVAELPLVHYESLQSLTVSDLYTLFQGTGLTHLLVVEQGADNQPIARGLLSRSSLALRLSTAPPVLNS